MVSQVSNVQGADLWSFEGRWLSEDYGPWTFFTIKQSGKEVALYFSEDGNSKKKASGTPVRKKDNGDSWSSDLPQKAKEQNAKVWTKFTLSSDPSHTLYGWMSEPGVIEWDRTGRDQWWPWHKWDRYEGNSNEGVKTKINNLRDTIINRDEIINESEINDFVKIFGYSDLRGQIGNKLRYLGPFVALDVFEKILKSSNRGNHSIQAVLQALADASPILIKKVKDGEKRIIDLLRQLEKEPEIFTLVKSEPSLITLLYDEQAKKRIDIQKTYKEKLSSSNEIVQREAARELLEISKSGKDPNDQLRLEILIHEWVRWIAYSERSKALLIGEVSNKMRTIPAAVKPLVDELNKEFQPDYVELQSARISNSSGTTSENEVSKAKKTQHSVPEDNKDNKTEDLVRAEVNYRHLDPYQKILTDLNESHPYQAESTSIEADFSAVTQEGNGSHRLTQNTTPTKKQIQSIIEKEFKSRQVRIHRRIAKQLADMSNKELFKKNRQSSDEDTDPSNNDPLKKNRQSSDEYDKVYDSILDELRKHAIPALVPRLPDEEDPDIRRDLAQVLGNVGGREAVDSLARAVVGEERTRAARQELLAKYYLDPSKERSEQAAEILKGAVDKAKGTLVLLNWLNSILFGVGVVLLVGGFAVNIFDTGNEANKGENTTNVEVNEAIKGENTTNAEGNEAIKGENTINAEGNEAIKDENITNAEGNEAIKGKNIININRRVAGYLASIGGVAGIIAQLIRDPLNRIQTAMANLVQLETAFTSFIWELNLNGTYIQSRYVTEGVLTVEEVGQTLDRIEKAMDLTMGLVSVHTDGSRVTPHISKLSPAIGKPGDKVMIHGQHLKDVASCSIAFNHLPLNEVKAPCKDNIVSFTVPETKSLNSIPKFNLGENGAYGVYWISLIVNDVETNALPFQVIEKNE